MSMLELVNSLSVAEKRHFTLYTGIKGRDKPKYVKLFNFINTKPDISVKELLNAGFSASDKNFLKEKIEESLHDLYLGKSIVSKLKWLTESMERYFKKRQWKELKNCIKKTKRLTKLHEQYLDWLQAIYWEKKMLLAQPKSRLLSENLERLYKEEEIVQHYLLEETNYCNLKNSLYALIIKDARLNNLVNRKKFERLISSDLLGADRNPASKKSQINFFYLKAKAAQYGNEKEEAYQFSNKLIKVFNNSPTFKKDNLDWYKRSICLLCEICDFSNKGNEIPALIKLIGNDSQHFKTVCLYGLKYSIGETDKTTGIEYLNKIKNILERKDHQIRHGGQLAIFYNGAVFWSLFSNWEEMNYWIQKILHFKRTDDRRDLQYGARILSLINHFELKSYDLDNQIQAVTHYFTRNNQYSKTNQYIIQIFRYLYRAVNRKQMIPIWTDLQNYLNIQLEAVNESTQQIGLGELSIWCTSKIENITMAEVYRSS